ncbi:MAG: hypothetical protein KatS3mg005_2730 [Bryobacteraceae bacterium]|nr:MAG: hypothetical protein KatS3mg005_2730 [Bryobacteraceae bacterium]
MRNLLTGWLAATLLLGLALPSTAPADDDDDGWKNDLGPKLWEAAIVRTAHLPADPASIIPFPWGNDPLDEGEIEVCGRGYVKLEIEGAVPNAEYSVLACRLSSSGDRCAGIGSVKTDEDGDAKVVLEWPAGTSGSQSVFFALRRAEATMFVSGFVMPVSAPPVPGAPPSAEIEVKGEVATVGASSFTISGVAQTILVGENTKFLGTLRSIGDLQPGIRVEVEGATTAGGILASRVQRKKK